MEETKMDPQTISSAKEAAARQSQPTTIPSTNPNLFGTGGVRSPLDLPPGLHPVGDGVPTVPAKDPADMPATPPQPGGGVTYESKQGASEEMQMNQRKTAAGTEKPKLQDDRDRERAPLTSFSSQETLASAAKRQDDKENGR
jgi:hypothetical protein